MNDITIINLNIADVNKTTDHAYMLRQTPSPIVYFRLHEDGYASDLSTFISLKLNITKLNGRKRLVETTNEIVTVNDERLIKFTATPDLLDEVDKLSLIPTVKIFNKSIVLQAFRILIYEKDSVGMRGMLEVIDKYNAVYGKYLKAIKRDQIDIPNGVVSLSDVGKIKPPSLPLFVTNHTNKKILDSEIHGIRLNSTSYMLEYYNGSIWKELQKSIAPYTWGYYKNKTWADMTSMTWCEMGGGNCPPNEELE